jgi:hypothetical protein
MAHRCRIRRKPIIVGGLSSGCVRDAPAVRAGASKLVVQHARAAAWMRLGKIRWISQTSVRADFGLTYPSRQKTLKRIIRIMGC